MSKKILVASVLGGFAGASHAFWGIGDITFDPTSYANAVKQFTEIQNLYNTAKNQLDNLQEIQRTVKEAQRTYKTVSSGDYKSLIGYLELDKSNVKSLEGLKSELAKFDSNIEGSSSYINRQKETLQKLEGMVKMKTAAVENVKESSGEIDPKAAAAISAQATSTLAALATSQEERRLREDYAKAKSAQQSKEAFNTSLGVLKAIGK